MPLPQHITPESMRVLTRSLAAVAVAMSDAARNFADFVDHLSDEDLVALAAAVTAPDSADTALAALACDAMGGEPPEPCSRFPGCGCVVR